MLAVTELTPRGPGAVSILSLEGDDVDAALRALCGHADFGEDRIVLSRLTLPGGTPGEARAEVIDEALVLRRSREVVELHLHGSPSLVQELRGFLAGAFGRPPSPLLAIEERARAAVSRAPCEAGARILLDQADGALARALRELADADAEAGARILDELLEEAQQARYALVPACVVLAGPVNAGKSTLFNALVGESRALVSPVEGTTRDLICERALLGGWPVDLVDGAGERELSDGSRSGAVERAGQDLARAARRAADFCVWLDPAEPAGAGAGSPRAARLHDPEAPIAYVTSRADQTSAAERGGSAVIRALEDPAGAARTVRQLFETALGLRRPIWVSGRAVPFEEGQSTALARAREMIDLDERRALIRDLLAPRVATPDPLG